MQPGAKPRQVQTNVQGWQPCRRPRRFLWRIGGRDHDDSCLANVRLYHTPDARTRLIRSLHVGQQPKQASQCSSIVFSHPGCFVSVSSTPHPSHTAQVRIAGTLLSRAGAGGPTPATRALLAAPSAARRPARALAAAARACDSLVSRDGSIANMCRRSAPKRRTTPALADSVHARPRRYAHARTRCLSDCTYAPQPAAGGRRVTRHFVITDDCNLMPQALSCGR